MKKYMILMLTFLVLAACGGDDTTDKQPPAVKTAMAEAEILSYVPADTPLFFASGLSNDLYPDRYVSVMQDYMKNVAEYLKITLSDAMETIDAADEDNKLDTDKETVQDIEGFVNRWLVDGQFEKVGMKVDETQMLGYMVDLFPVVRIKLASGHQIPAMFDDLDAEFKLTVQKSELDDLTLREYSYDKVTILAANNDDYLVLSMAPTVIKDQLVKSLMGIDKPAQSLAAQRELLDDVKTKHGFITDDVFVMDVQKMADYFINPDNYDSAMLNFLQIEDNKLSPVCKTEINAMIAKAPRMVAGMTALTDNVIDSALIWEMDNELSQDLAQLAGRIPATDKQAAFSFGMSFNLLNSQKVASKYIDNILNAPYQCELFSQLNQQAETLKARISQPLPPFVSNFKGFNMSFSDLKVNQQAADLNNPAEMIESFKAQLSLSVDEAQSLVGMAQMMLPQLQGMTLPTDGSLIPLKQQLPANLMSLPVDVSTAFAAINNHTIGLSMGYADGGNLSELVSQDGENLLLSVTADADGYKQVMTEIFKLADMPQLPEEVKKQLQSQKQMTMNMLYWQQQKTTMQFTDKGLATRMTISY